MRFKHIQVEESEKHQAVVEAIKKAGLTHDIVTEKNVIPNYRKGKNTLNIIAKKGEAMDTCATISDKYICCNVKVLKSVSNCPYDCSYCFLQNYLNDGTTKVVGDEDALIAEVKEKCALEPDRLFRIGTWELGDSLALENETKQASRLIEAFKDIPNAVLELKTKSANVNPILNIDHQKRTVVSWSLNTETIINREEHKTARLHERVDAIKKVSKAGYLLGFHFDPMIIHEHWEKEVDNLIKQVLEVANHNQIAWISIGSLRFNPEMKKKMEQNFPATKITSSEMVCGDDGKVRYVKPTRLYMYQHVITLLKKYLNITDCSPLTANIKQTPLIYFCMERWDVWDSIFGNHPSSISHLDNLFQQSLEARFYH